MPAHVSKRRRREARRSEAPLARLPERVTAVAGCDHKAADDCMRGACRTVTIQRNDKSKRVRRCGGSKNRQLVAGEQQLESNILQAISQARARSLKCESTFSQEILASTEPNRTTGVSLLVAHWPCNVAIHRRFRRPLMQADSRDTKDSLFRRHTRPPTRTALLVRGVVRSASETMYRDVVNRAVLAVHQNRPVIASS